MNRRVVFVAVLSVGLICTQFCRAGDTKGDRLNVLGIVLSLGMSKAEVFPPFSGYKVNCLGSSAPAPDCDSWLIQASAPPYTPFANLIFKQGKLISVMKYWERGYEGNNPSKFVNTLYAIMAEYNGERGEVTIQTAESEQVNQKAIFITKGRRTLTISTSSGLRSSNGEEIPEFVNLYETLSK